MSSPPTPSTLDNVPEQAFRALLRTIGAMDRVMQPYFAQFGISRSQWAVMRHLSRAECQGQDGLRLTDLSERLIIRPPSVTGVVGRLERDGLVARAASRGDLRAKKVRLTAKGKALVNRVLTGHRRQIQKVMAGLDESEQSELLRLLTQLGEHLNQRMEPVARRTEKV
jgi:MarR family 2-MHQ and catechol resistance regulon transcriptional repressor